MAFLTGKTRIWDRATPNDGFLLEDEFNRLYENFREFLQRGNLIINNDAGSASCVQLTNSAIGTSLTDGLKIEVGSSGEAFINQQENQSLVIKTNSNTRLTIDNNGIATFTSIPVLPASNPTSDNQAVRKAYSDLQAVRNGVPVGTITAWLPGYFTNGNNGGYTAASVTLPDWWRECNGAEVNNSSSPIYNGIGRFLPNLTDNRFLMGNSSGNAGLTGGNNSSAHTHSHIHSIAHTHNIAHSHTIAHTHDISHTHTMAHTHTLSHTHTYNHYHNIAHYHNVPPHYHSASGSYTTSYSHSHTINNHRHTIPFGVLDGGGFTWYGGNTTVGLYTPGVGELAASAPWSSRKALFTNENSLTVGNDTHSHTNTGTVGNASALNGDAWFVAADMGQSNGNSGYCSETTTSDASVTTTSAASNASTSQASTTSSGGVSTFSTGGASPEISSASSAANTGSDATAASVTENRPLYISVRYIQRIY